VPLLVNAFAGIGGATLGIVGAHTLPGAPPSIRVHGEVRDRARLRDLISQADFVVVPSYAEGMPTIILEAFAQAVPAIATDVGASADLVRTGETGLLIPAGDTGALRQAMTTAMSFDAETYSRLSANCLRQARTTYAPETIRDQFVSLIDRLAGGHNVNNPDA
jgi:glycosyltransferase involved in cell wall biosynthesis